MIVMIMIMIMINSNSSSFKDKYQIQIKVISLENIILIAIEKAIEKAYSLKPKAMTHLANKLWTANSHSLIDSFLSGSTKYFAK